MSRASGVVHGVEIIGSGCHYPQGKMTNADLEKILDTSDEWIFKRTGIRERRRCDPNKGESVTSLCSESLRKAIVDANIEPGDIDMLILGTVTGEMSCPATACRVAANVGAIGAGAYDLAAACSGFVFGIHTAHDLIRCGSFKTVAVVGCDVMSEVLDYEDRGVVVLFGDSSGAAILQASDDESKGMLAGSMHADGSRWADLYIPRKVRDFPDGVQPEGAKLGKLRMSGREVYKFAVGTFSKLIEETLADANVDASEIDMYVCHQSNARMLESARERFGIPKEKMYINIDRFGNCSGGSVPVCLDELRKMGQCKHGDKIMFVAFGGGMTWGASVWQL